MRSLSLPEKCTATCTGIFSIRHCVRGVCNVYFDARTLTSNFGLQENLISFRWNLWNVENVGKSLDSWRMINELRRSCVCVCVCCANCCCCCVQMWECECWPNRPIDLLVFSITMTRATPTRPTVDQNFIFGITIKVKPQLINVMAKYVFMWKTVVHFGEILFRVEWANDDVDESIQRYRTLW